MLTPVLAKPFSRVLKIGLKGKSKVDQTKLILSSESPFVAILDQNQRFEKLIDRQKLADEMIKSLVNA